ncbi:MAG TPA: methyltransferase [Flavisolibacter sp.]
MPNPYFQFKQFIVHHDRCAMKVTTDACLFGAWIAKELVHTGSKNKNLLDIGTGTGLLSLMVVQENDMQIDAVEIDAAAAEQAQENIEASPWKERIHVINENIIHTSSNMKYDAIMCNPPFYENELASPRDQKNLAHHSSELKLQQVMDIIRNRLKPGGRFYLLLPFKRHEESIELMDRSGAFFIKQVIVKPTPAHSPIRLMACCSFSKNENTEVVELAIRNEGQEYSPEFTSLLRNYYLYL